VQSSCPEDVVAVGQVYGVDADAVDPGVSVGRGVGEAVATLALGVAVVEPLQLAGTTAVITDVIVRTTRRREDGADRIASPFVKHEAPLDRGCDAISFARLCASTALVKNSGLASSDS
jgi:hypothetical protein